MADNEGGLIVSYLTLRRIVGGLGMSLPFVLAGWGKALGLDVLPSISDYYAKRPRDALVGVLVTIGWFLYSYRGYDRRDLWMGNLAGVLAILVALFPNSGSRIEAGIHFTSAGALFVLLAAFSAFQFTQTRGAPSARKLVRNRVYTGCGVLMFGCVVSIAIYDLFLKNSALAELKPVFYLESLALEAFGVSWLVKGETVLKDLAPVPASPGPG